MKSTTFITAVLTVGALVGVSMMDWSSMCHPSKETMAMQNQIIRVADAKMANRDSEPNEVYRETVEEDLSELTWQLLSDVDFREVFLEELDSYYWMPTFGPNVRAAEGNDYYITGYVIPVDVDDDFYVLSRYPFANCFFCGGAGPESVIDLRFPAGSSNNYELDDRLTFRGTLRLNADDVYQMNYILDGAVLYD